MQQHCNKYINNKLYLYNKENAYEQKKIKILTLASLLIISQNSIATPFTDKGNKPIHKFVNDSNLNFTKSEHINTELASEIAIYAYNSQGSVKDVTIETIGSSSAGLTLEQKSKVNIGGNISITTNGGYAYGLEIEGDLSGGNSTDKTGASTVTALENTVLTIETNGNYGHAFQVRQGSSLDLSSLSDTTRSKVTTNGSNANALNTNTFGTINIKNIDFYVNDAIGFNIFGSGDLSLSNTSLSSKNQSIVVNENNNEEVKLNINIDESQIVANDGNFITNGTKGDNDVVNIKLDNNSYVKGTSIIEKSTGETNIDVTNKSKWEILNNSTVTNFNVNNGGEVYLTNKTQGNYNTLTVNGNYIGGSVKPILDSTGNGIETKDTSNGTIYVNTVWNNDEATSKTDSLIINGTATGYTEVKVVGNIIVGDVTNNGTAGKYFYQPVVYVNDHKLGNNAFYGFAKTTGAGLARLVQQDDHSYTWYVNGTSTKPLVPMKPASNDPNGSEPVNKEETINSEKPIKSLDPVNPSVPEAVLMPKANLNAVYSILSTLHERVSEQQTMAWDDCSTCQVDNKDKQVWGRFIGNYNKFYGKDRYDYRSKLWGMQFGYDFNVDYDSDHKSRSHTGIMITYAKDNLSFYDSKSVYFNNIIGDYAEKNSKTGHGQSDIYSLGAYHTYYDKNGSYMDFVGMFNYIRNKYNTYDGSNNKNHAYGFALSAEFGRPFAITNNGLHSGDWFIEPQGQLIYQYLTYNDYKTTGDLKVDQNNQQGLRGRLGARIAYNKGDDELKTQTIYFTGNIIHDFINQKEINFGTSHVSEKMNKTTGEIGVGIQLPLAKSSYAYFDTRYYHSLGNSNGKTKGFSGTLGLKYYW